MHQSVLRLLVCGSVDDGKSTLIGRLLLDRDQVPEDQLDALIADSRVHGTTGGGIDPALLTDGLSAEREQGITIDVAWRVLTTPSRRVLIADTPGHVQHTRNMATGASACDAAVVLVDASRGILAQTRRHVTIATMMGIRHLVFAINKLDLVGCSEDRFESLAQGCRDLAEVGIEVHAVPIIARDGDNVVQASDRLAWWPGATLLATVEALAVDEPRRAVERPMRFPVQLVQRPNASFRGYAGTVAAGTLRVGELIRVLPSGMTSRVARIVTFDGDRDSAQAGDAVTLTLEDELDVSRGDLLVHADAPNVSLPLQGREIDATLVWLDHRPLSELRGLQLRSLTGASSARVSELHSEIDVETGEERSVDDVLLNAVVHAVVEVEKDHVWDPYAQDRATGAFVLIDRATGAVVAGGMARGLASPWDREALATLRAQPSDIDPDERTVRYGHDAATIVITGLTGTGKTTLARALERALFDHGAVAVRLDGEDLRLGISRGLGFAPSERAEHLRRAAETARILNEHGQLVVLAVQAPGREVRARMLETIGADRYVGIHLEAPDDVRRHRDPDGVADEREMATTYERPEDADLVFDTSLTTIEDSIHAILERLRSNGVLPLAEMRPATVWLTGLSGSGKSTIARALTTELQGRGVSVRLLDGDEVRASISADLGFSLADRAEQIRRVGELAREQIASGSVCVVSLIAPLRTARNAVRAAHEPGAFLEVHVATSLGVCEQRDPKGLYARARAGEISDFTGIDSPYEPPEQPELVVDDRWAIEDVVQAIVAKLEQP